MQQLRMNMNSSNDAILIRHIKLDSTEKRIIKLQNDLKDLFYLNREIKNLSAKINLKEGAQMTQRKEKLIVS